MHGHMNVKFRWSSVTVSPVSANSEPQKFHTSHEHSQQEMQTEFFQTCTQVELSKDPPIWLDLPIMHI
jgi:hypothetical protein